MLCVYQYINSINHVWVSYLTKINIQLSLDEYIRVSIFHLLWWYGTKGRIKIILFLYWFSLHVTLYRIISFFNLDVFGMWIHFIFIWLYQESPIVHHNQDSWRNKSLLDCMSYSRIFDIYDSILYKYHVLGQHLM